MWQLQYEWLDYPQLNVACPSEGDYVALPEGLNKVFCAKYHLWYLTVENNVVVLVQMPGRDC